MYRQKDADHTVQLMKFTRLFATNKEPCRSADNHIRLAYDSISDLDGHTGQHGLPLGLFQRRSDTPTELTEKGAATTPLPFAGQRGQNTTAAFAEAATEADQIDGGQVLTGRFVWG